MLTPEQVAEIWAGVRALVKPHYRVGESFMWERDGQEGRTPEFWPGYRDAVKEYERLEPHILHGEFPEALFRHRAPNAGPEELAYMRANFKQVTLPVYADAENTVLRALDDANFQVIYGDGTQGSETDREDFTAYVNEGIREHGSVMDYVRGVALRMKSVDAMGLMVVRPDTLPTVEVEGDGGVPMLVIDPDRRVEPAPHYVKCKDVWGFELDRWYLWRSEERSEVMRGDKAERIGLVLYLADDTSFYRIVQVGKAQDFQFAIVKWWDHECGMPPCIHLKGTPVIDDGFLRWQSYYLPACEPLDQVLLDTSYLMASKAKVAFPHMVVLDDPCGYLDQTTGAACFNGTLEWVDDKGTHQRQCPSCKGSGSQSRLGPLGEVRVRQTSERVPEAKTADALTFVSPPTETLTFLRSEIEYNLAQARHLLHLHSETPITSGDAVTATQVGVGVRAAQAFVKPIADGLLTLAEFVLDCIGKQRLGDRYPGITITRPSTYDVRTEEDLMQEYKASLSTMPPPVAEGILWQFIKARYGHSPEQLTAWRTIAAADTLFASTPATVQQLLAQRIVEPWQVALHQQSFGIYESLMREGALVGEVEADAPKLIERAKAITPAPQQTPASSRLNELIQR